MHDCVATHSPNTIIKFADDTTVIGHGLLTGDDDTAYREEVTGQSPDILVPGQQPPSQHQQNKGQTKELIVDFRRRQREEHAPLSIDRTTVERVNSFRFLHQLQRLNMDSRILCSFYRLYREVVKAAQHIIRTELPSMEDLYTQRCRGGRATMIIMDPSHPATDCSVCCRLA
ncbi:hypothetical protein L3Q82_012239, partial [Scortum barcoo]